MMGTYVHVLLSRLEGETWDLNLTRSFNSIVNVWAYFVLQNRWQLRISELQCISWGLIWITWNPYLLQWRMETWDAWNHLESRTRKSGMCVSSWSDSSARDSSIKLASPITWKTRQPLYFLFELVPSISLSLSSALVHPRRSFALSQKGQSIPVVRFLSLIYLRIRTLAKSLSPSSDYLPLNLLQQAGFLRTLSPGSWSA